MLPLFISLLYTISIIIATFVLITYSKNLRDNKYLLLTLIGTYSLGKWLLLKMPEIKMMSGITFGDSLLFGLILFSFIVLPFFNIFDKYIREGKISEKDNQNIFYLFIAFLFLHTVPEAIQIGYQFNFVSNGNIGEVLKAIIEEIPEFIMLLSIYIILSHSSKKSMILGIMTGLLFPITTLLVSIFANTANESLEIMTKNILLGFYIIFGIMSFNLLLKYKQKFIILFVFIIVLIVLYRSFIGI